jgi:hypothetical protein
MAFHKKTSSDVPDFDVKKPRFRWDLAGVAAVITVVATLLGIFHHQEAKDSPTTRTSQQPQNTFKVERPPNSQPVTMKNAPLSPPTDISGAWTWRNSDSCTEIDLTMHPHNSISGTWTDLVPVTNGKTYKLVEIVAPSSTWDGESLRLVRADFRNDKDHPPVLKMEGKELTGVMTENEHHVKMEFLRGKMIELCPGIAKKTQIPIRRTDHIDVPMAKHPPHRLPENAKVTKGERDILPDSRPKKTDRDPTHCGFAYGNVCGGPIPPKPR